MTGEWRDIKSAPKKNGRILAVVDGETRVVSYCKTSHLPWVGWCLVDQGAEDCDLCEPTLWQPLPKPPTAIDAAVSTSSEQSPTS